MNLRKIRGALINSLPCWIKNPLIYRYRYHIPEIKEKRMDRIRLIKSKGCAKALFIVSSLSIWKYEEILDLLSKDQRFETDIIICPFPSYSDQAKKLSIEQLKDYFSKKGLKYSEYNSNDEDQQKLINKKNYDLIFYPMPYEGLYDQILEYTSNKEKLLCYTPYGVNTSAGELFINTHFHNLAWKIFSTTPLHKTLCKKYTVNRGENIVVVGENNSEKVRDKNSFYEWKTYGNSTKKIIWAPHYSIMEGHAFNRVAFLWLSSFMLEIADQYNGKISIVFKPHPKLRTLMYEHPEWGKKRTDEYFEKWRIGRYTGLEEGEYSTLFATSDAMIHDSSSFIGEYMYTTKPVLFTSKDFKSVRNECNEFGNACIDLHYHAVNQEDIIQFIDNVLLGGKDPLKEQRERFYKEMLSFNDDLTPGKRIYMNILSEFGWKINN